MTDPSRRPESRNSIHEAAVSIDDFTILARSWMRRTLIAQILVLVSVILLCSATIWLIWESQRISQSMTAAITRLQELEATSAALGRTAEQVRSSVQADIDEHPSLELVAPTRSGKPQAVVVIKPRTPQGAPGASAVSIPLAVPSSGVKPE